MVRACLRVLKHHGVVALVDMFCYTNRYEVTERVIGSELLNDAAEFVIKRSAQDLTKPISDGANDARAVEDQFHHRIQIERISTTRLPITIC
jgi:hypothetical protein